MLGLKRDRKVSEDTAEGDQPRKRGLFAKLKSGLSKTRALLNTDIGDLLRGRPIDDDLVDELETRLLMADVGVEATNGLLEPVRQRIDRREITDAEGLTSALEAGMVDMLRACEAPLVIGDTPRPFVLLVVGVNGSGKTTTIGKLAKQFSAQGLSVMLAAGDTFRAAAVEQLRGWGERNHVPVIAQGTGADSASVIFDGIQAASARGIDVLIADTAGRLHTQGNLMDELRKIKRVAAKQDPTAPHEVLLVLDAGIGQNALVQARQFNDAVGVTGIALTKLDGTAKGGIVLAIAKQMGIPLRYLGVGEAVDDLRPFEAEAFARALLAPGEDGAAAGGDHERPTERA